MRNGTRRTIVLAPFVGMGVAALVRMLRGAPTPAFQPRPGGVPTLRPEVPTAPVESPEPVAPAASTEPADPEPGGEAEPGGQAEEDAAPPSDPRKGWVQPVDGACPTDYPVKVKLRSGIFHQPGMLAYERTIPDRCYPTVEAAAADGFRPAKR